MDIEHIVNLELQILECRKEMSKIDAEIQSIDNSYNWSLHEAKDGSVYDKALLISIKQRQLNAAVTKHRLQQRMDQMEQERNHITEELIIRNLNG